MKLFYKGLFYQFSVFRRIFITEYAEGNPSFVILRILLDPLTIFLAEKPQSHATKKYYKPDWLIKKLVAFKHCSLDVSLIYALCVLGHSLKVAKETLNTLKENEWLTSETRAVLVEFVLYNPNLNVFAVFSLTFEFLVTGCKYY